MHSRKSSWGQSGSPAGERKHTKALSNQIMHNVGNLLILGINFEVNRFPNRPAGAWEWRSLARRDTPCWILCAQRQRSHGSWPPGSSAWPLTPDWAPARAAESSSEWLGRSPSSYRERGPASPGLQGENHRGDGDTMKRRTTFSTFKRRCLDIYIIFHTVWNFDKWWRILL